MSIINKDMIDYQKELSGVTTVLAGIIVNSQSDDTFKTGIQSESNGQYNNSAEFINVAVLEEIVGGTASVMIEESEDNTTFTEVSSTKIGVLIGSTLSIPFPSNVKKYLRTSIVGSASLTAGMVDAYRGQPIPNRKTV